MARTGNNARVPALGAYGGGPTFAADLTEIAGDVADILSEGVDTESALPASGNWPNREITAAGVTFKWLNGKWVRHNFGRLGSNRVTTRITVPGNAWGDLVVVTASSSGALCVADWKAQFANANSGGNRVLSFRLLVDGVQVGSDIGYDVPLSSGLIGYSAAFDFESSPAAGSHVWRLQGNASTASAVYVNQAVLTVTEQ